MFIEILDLNRGRTLLNVNNIIYINEDVENNRVILSIVDSLLITNEPYEKIIEKINGKYMEDAVKFQKLLNNCDAETSIIEE